MSIRFENMTQAQVHEFTREHPVYCTEDHCTPEERAVIEAALAWLNDGDDRRLSPAQEHLVDTLTALPTTRSKSEVRE